MHSICTPLAEEIYTEELQFLVNDDYPSSPKVGNISCNCSIEVDDCFDKINIYNLHIGLRET